MLSGPYRHIEARANAWYKTRGRYFANPFGKEHHLEKCSITKVCVRPYCSKSFLVFYPLMVMLECAFSINWNSFGYLKSLYGTLTCWKTKFFLLAGFRSCFIPFLQSANWGCIWVYWHVCKVYGAAARWRALYLKRTTISSYCLIHFKSHVVVDEI